MTYRIEVRVDAATRWDVVVWIKRTAAAPEPDGPDYAHAGGGQGGVDFNVYVGPRPLTDRERIEELERRVAELAS